MVSLQAGSHTQHPFCWEEDIGSSGRCFALCTYISGRIWLSYFNVLVWPVYQSENWFTNRHQGTPHIWREGKKSCGPLVEVAHTGYLLCQCRNQFCDSVVGCGEKHDGNSSKIFVLYLCYLVLEMLNDNMGSSHKYKIVKPNVSARGTFV